MSKAVLLSIHPEWCKKIAMGEKTIEVRKTRPRLDTPFKCYIYETKGYERAGNADYTYVIDGGGRGAVIGEFACNEILPMTLYRKPLGVETTLYEVPGTCLRNDEIGEYLNGDGYGWHISDLVIYDKPRRLSEFYRERAYNGLLVKPIQRPPQSWCYVEED